MLNITARLHWKTAERQVFLKYHVYGGGDVNGHTPIQEPGANNSKEVLQSMCGGQAPFHDKLLTRLSCRDNEK